MLVLELIRVIWFVQTPKASIDNLVGILTTAVLSGSLAGIPTSINFGVADCADVRESIFNYVGIVTTAVSGIGSIPHSIIHKHNHNQFVSSLIW